MKTKILLMVAAVGIGAVAQEWSVKSPDGRNEIVLSDAPLSYKVLRDGKVMVADSEIGMKVDGACLRADGKSAKFSRRALSGKASSPVYKKSSVDLSGNEGFADFGSWGVRLVARNDGVAYRFETMKPGTIRVDCEKAQVKVPHAKARCWFNRTSSVGCEETVPEKADAESLPRDPKKMVYLPFVYSVDGKTVAVSESDLVEYPIWNLVPGEGMTLSGRFEKFPKSKMRVGGWGGKKEDMNLPSGGRWLRVTEREEFLVKTSGTRTFPWRWFALADSPGKLCEADLAWALARPSSGDFSWVKPGKVAWDWWNDWNLEGVSFKAGCNTKSYEYYIDFASANGVEYVIFDEGWSESLNIWKFSPDVDVPYLIDYANKKGVGIILWLAWAQAYGDEDRVVEHFSKMGAKGFKVDFMDRGDAEIPVFLEKFAGVCAKHHMLVDYHGAYRPVGLSRTYPNVLNYEGIHGLEQMKWFKNTYDMMSNDVMAFFLRLTAGPMDYTPGAMLNHPVGGYKGDNHSPGSVGTRCRQMAMMALYEAPLQMLCDSPTNYEKNKESFKFMAATPVTWDDTVGLSGCPETMAAVARRKGDAWYAAAITNSEKREWTLDTAFLGEGEWKMELFRDHNLSAVMPMRYIHETRNVRAGDKQTFILQPGGGMVARFTPVKR